MARAQFHWSAKLVELLRAAVRVVCAFCTSVRAWPREPLNWYDPLQLNAPRGRQVNPAAGL